MYDLKNISSQLIKCCLKRTKWKTWTMLCRNAANLNFFCKSKEKSRLNLNSKLIVWTQNSTWSISSLLEIQCQIKRKMILQYEMSFSNRAEKPLKKRFLIIKKTLKERLIILSSVQPNLWKTSNQLRKKNILSKAYKRLACQRKQFKVSCFKSGWQ